MNLEYFINVAFIPTLIIISKISTCFISITYKSIFSASINYWFNVNDIFKGQQAQQDSPKKSVDKGPAPNPPLSGEAQLKYENDRLKLALAQR